MEGILNLLKPPGMSSHDAVAAVRRITGEKRAGHAGTLDPAAAGVLPVFLGRAVRLVEFTLDKEKAYRVEAVLGVSTPTFDLEAEPVRVEDASSISESDIESAARSLVGDVDQEVPAYSAVQVGGRRLYNIARSGQEVPCIIRRVTISSLTVLSMELGPNPRVLFDVVCSRGTFVRTICRDLGERLGVGGAMSFLIRTSTGPFRLREALTLDEIEANVEASLLPGHFALSGYARAVLNENASQVICHGIKPAPEDYCHVDDLVEGAIISIFSPAGQFLAVGEARSGSVHIRKVLCQ